jgi:phage terminase large subunit-like protein
MKDYVAIAMTYQSDVLSGAIPACKWVRAACERNRRDLLRQGTDSFPYTFSGEAGSKVCRMAEMLPHVKGPKAFILRDPHSGMVVSDDQERPVWNTIVLEAWQCWILITLFGWLRLLNGLRRFRVSLCLIPRKNAKALALDTEIPTPDGFKRMGDLRVGDFVFGADGRPTRIVAESEVLVGQRCYEVTFSTGERVVADAGHLWLTRARVHAPGTKYRGGQSPAVGPTRVRTTEEIGATLRYGRRRDVNHSVRLAAPIELPDAVLPIDPYALGVWLGAGDSAAGRFTSVDPEVVDEMARIEGELRLVATKGEAASYAIGPSYRAGNPARSTFQGRLCELGVLNNKHIPIRYLRSSRTQRVSLLQGLMDTAGSASKAGQLTFRSTCDRLAADVSELVASLGLKPSRNTTAATIGGRVVGAAYKIQFWAGSFPVFRIARKRSRQRDSSPTARSKTRQIVSVTEVESVPVKCITVDSTDQLFLAGRSFVPTHNSTLAAVVVLYMLVADGESGAECYSAATTRDQAKAIAEIAWEMARRSPAFREYFGVRMGSETTKSLSVPANGSKFMPLSADAHTLDSLNVSLAAIDELHAHKTDAVWNVLDTATGARPQPIIFAITTAGVDIGGVCRSKLDYLEKLLDLDGSVKDETFFGINYTIDPGDDIRLESIQRKANPNFGVSVFPDDLERKVTAAINSPAALNNVLTKHFNVWIRSESAWMTATVWQACTSKAVSAMASHADRRAALIEQWKAFPCWIGVDLGEVRDYSACTLLFKLPEDRWGLVVFIYIPEDGASQSPVAQLSGWIREDAAIVTSGSEADYARIEADLLGWIDTLNVREVDFDRRSARLMIQDFRKELEPSLGRDRVEQMVLDIPQNVETMDPAMKIAERIVVGLRIEHDGNPIQAWMVANIVIERNHKDEIYPRKAGGKDSPNKIDGPISFFTGLSQASIAKDTEPEFQMFFAGGRKP